MTMCPLCGKTVPDTYHLCTPSFTDEEKQLLAHILQSWDGWISREHRSTNFSEDKIYARLRERFGVTIP